MGKDLLLRLLPQPIKEDCTENANIDIEIQVEEFFYIKTQLEKAIQSAVLKQELNNEDLSIKYINKNFSVFESTKKRISNLETLFQCLKTIQPTSDYNTIDTLCFLKSYYKNNKNDEKIETEIGLLI